MSARVTSKVLELNILDEAQTVLSRPHYLQENNLSMHIQALLNFSHKKSLEIQRLKLESLDRLSSMSPTENELHQN